MATTCRAQEPPRFSYHTTLSSPQLALKTSTSASPSRSPVSTAIAPSASLDTTLRTNVGTAAPSFSYHATVLSSLDDDTTSMSWSESRSATATELAPSAVVEIFRADENLADVHANPRPSSASPTHNTDTHTTTLPRSTIPSFLRN